MGCKRTGRLCARSCTVPQRPRRSPPAIRSPTGYQTPKLMCSDGCSIASRTVAAAAVGGPWRDETWCVFSGGYNNIIKTNNDV